MYEIVSIHYNNGRIAYDTNHIVTWLMKINHRQMDVNPASI